MGDEESRAGGSAMSWRSSTPRLIGAIRLAFDPRKLVIAAIGVVLQSVYLRFDGLFPDLAAVTPDLLETATPTGFMLPTTSRDAIWDQLAILHHGISEPIRWLTVPLLAMLEPGAGWARMLQALLIVLWVIIVWGICGGAIARIAIVRVAKVRQTGIGEALRFALRSAVSLILAPLCPMLGLAVCGAIVAAFGLLYRVPVVGSTIAGILLVIPLGLGLLMALFVAGLVAGWPLMVASVAAGAENAMDAWSRTYSYLTQRLGQFAALLALVWLEGIVGLILVGFLAASVIRLTLWGLGLTAGGAHPFWVGWVGIFAKSWIYSYFWTTAGLLYLWLRHDVDGTPWSDCEKPLAAP